MHDVIPDVIPNEKKPIEPPTGIEEWYDDYEDEEEFSPSFNYNKLCLISAVQCNWIKLG